MNAIVRMNRRTRLRISIERARKAYWLGYHAEDRCQDKRACPFANVPGQRMERMQWMKGFARSAQDREIATS